MHMSTSHIYIYITHALDTLLCRETCVKIPVRCFKDSGATCAPLDAVSEANIIQLILVNNATEVI